MEHITHCQVPLEDTTLEKLKIKTGIKNTKDALAFVVKEYLNEPTPTPKASKAKKGGE